jgi:hypothetical protein
MRPISDYRSLYNDETKAYIATMCAKEIEMFNYRGVLKLSTPCG